tara:strand:- start:219496 stop:221082 length:1587 start_codon:yes stop_codon:yes gene_type:complete
MHKSIWVIGFFLFLTSCTSIKNYNEDITTLHNPNKLQKDVDKAYRKLRKLHPKLYQFITKKDLDFKFDSLRNAISYPMTSLDFYKKLAPVISEVRQGHISVSPPSKKYKKKERKELVKKKFEFYDLEFENVKDAFLVKTTYGKDSTLIGDEVLEINEEPIKNLVENYKKLFSSDGYNTTFYDKFIALRFSSFYFKDKGYLDSLSITLKKQDSIYIKVLRRISKDSLEDKSNLKDSIRPNKIVKLSKYEQKLKREKIKTIRKNNLKYGYIKSKKVYTRNFDFIGKDNSIAYLQVRNFTNGKYKEFYKEVFQKIDSAKSKNLIIDLRDNTGGRLDEIANLYSYLIDENFQFIEKGQTLTRIPFLKAFVSSKSSIFANIVGVLSAPITIPIELMRGSKKKGVVYYKLASSRKNRKPNDLNFKGNLYVLINGNSFSASSILSTNLKATHRATFVGEETGGHYNGTVAGVYKFVRLPTSKIMMNFGLLQIQSPYQNTENGYGIKPDVKIIPTKADRMKDFDPELDWIFQQIEK